MDIQGFASDMAADVTSAMSIGYPVEAATPATPAPAETNTEQPQATTGAEAAEEASGTTDGDASKPTTAPEAKAEGGEDEEQLTTADQYTKLSREQAIQELEKRDRRIAGSEYGVLKLQAEHREQLAQLEQARQLMEIGEKNDPKATLDWMADYLAKTHGIPKEQLLGVQTGQSQGYQPTTLQFDESGALIGAENDKQFVDGILGEVQKLLAPVLQKVQAFEQHAPILGSLAQKESQTAQEAAMRAKAQESVPLFKSAAKLKGVELTDEEAVNTALYKINHPTLSEEDCIFLCNKEKVKGAMLGKTPATGPTIAASSGGARESQHGNPGPGAGRAAQLTAIALSDYPQA